MALTVLVLCLAVTVSSVVAAQEWWRTASFYQIYPRSFKDSDGDGVGDLNGITSKVDYLKDLGVNAVWLSPIYKSPMADFGYDISNFTDVDPIFGNLDDLKKLITALKERGIRIILDFVPNHSSDEHPWFVKSVKKEGNYSDFYVWKDKTGYKADGTPAEPNNWQSVFSGSAWKWSNERQQFYLHQFDVKQPDLNFRNPLVVEAIKEVMEFWLDLGVDGFRVDAIISLVEDEALRNESLIDPKGSLSYYNMNHIYTANQNLTFTNIEVWSDLIKEKNKDGKNRVMFLEVYNPIADTIRYYGGADAPFTLPFNFHLLEAINQGMTAADLVASVDEWIKSIPSSGTANWVVGNHDQGRVANRAGPEMVDAMNMLLAMLPGIMTTYNGEELGMTDTYLRFEETVDPRGTLLGPGNYRAGSRDPARTPLQWDDTQYAGFSNHTTWLPVNPNYWTLNVQAQNKADKSHLKVYKRLCKLRQTATFQSVETKHEINATNKETLVIKRSSPKGETYVLIVNFASTEITPDWPITNVNKMIVYTASINSGFSEGEVVSASQGIKLRPKAAVIMQASSAISLAASVTLAFISLCTLLLG